MTKRTIGLKTAAVLAALVFLPGHARSQGTGATGDLRGNTGAATVTVTTEFLVPGTSTVIGLSGASKSYYITDVILSNGATSQTLQLVSSTTSGNACATSQLTVGPPITLEVNSGMAKHYRTALKVTANSTICCKPSGSSAFSCEVVGYVAP